MSAIAFDTLYEEVSGKRDIIDALTKPLTVPMSYILVLILNCSLISANYKLAKILKRTDSLDCVPCEHFSAADFLSALDDIIKSVHEIMEFQKNIAPSVFLKINRHYIDIIEDKYENLLLGSDNELKSLVSSVSNGINKEFAAK